MTRNLHAFAVALILAASVSAGERPPFVWIDFYQNDKARYFKDFAWAGFTPDDKHVCYRLADGKARTTEFVVRDATTGKVISTRSLGKVDWFHNGDENCVLDPKGKWVGYGEGGRIRFLPLPEGDEITDSVKPDVLTHKEPLSTAWIAPSKDGASVLVIDDTAPHHSAYRIDLKTGATVTAIDGKLPVAHSMAATADRLALVTSAPKAGDRCEVSIWRTDAKPVERRFAPKYSASHVAFSADGALLAVGVEDGSVHVIDPDTAESKFHLPLAPKRLTITALAFDRSGKYLFCGSTNQDGDHNFFVVDVAKGELIRSFSSNPLGVRCICLSNSGRDVLVVGLDRFVLWRVADLLPAPPNK